MKLFAKIFLSYWAAQALFLMLAMIVALATRPSSPVLAVEASQHKILGDSVAAWQTGGEESLRRYLRSVHDTYQVHIYLFNEQGRELTGRRPPDWVERVRRGQERTVDSFWGRLGPGQLLRNAQDGGDGHRYTLVVDFPPEHHGFFGVQIPGLGLMIGIVSSGFVCFLLARYLTSPLVRLRAATQRLAAGDLAARAGEPGARRHDEIAELVRDFDAMAARLQNLVTAQNRLLNDISHELRSPLARLNVALGLVRRKTTPEVQGSLDRIEQEADRLNELIGRLLTVARLESGEDQLARSPIKVTELIREVAQDAEFEAQSRSCRVRVNGAQDCVVLGSPELLRSALENVVRNATRYTAAGTNVDVKVECRTGEALIEVSDSGPGVPDAALDKLFRPFYRIDDSRERGTGGVGLGLSITERAVRLHGGTVRAVNRPQGGLMVEIRLPALLPSPSEPVAAEIASKI